MFCVWQPIPEEHRNGRISKYTLTFDPELGKNFTDSVPGGDNFSMLQLNGSIGYTAYLEAWTSKGTNESLPKTTIFIAKDSESK